MFSRGLITTVTRWLRRNKQNNTPNTHDQTMLIQTKYEVGQKVYFFDSEKGQFQQGEIKTIEVHVHRDYDTKALVQRISYEIKTPETKIFGKTIQEASVFKDKNEIAEFALRTTANL